MSRYSVNKTLSLILGVGYLGLSIAAQASENCYASIDYMPKVSQKADRALYVLVDQTLPLPETMRQKIAFLLETWGKPGDLVKIVRFSSHARGKYPELMFSQQLPKNPSEEYLFNLRYNDRQSLKTCLESQQQEFSDNYQKALVSALGSIDPSIAKTELLFTLRDLSKQLINTDEARSHTVLLISDGLENSASLSFYKRGQMRKLDARGIINKLRREGLIGFWKGANIYMYGLGLVPDEKKAIKTEALKQLRVFWEQYFVEGGGRVKALGMPELLVTAIE